MPTYSFKNYFCRYKSSDGSLVNVDLYDTAGQENFHAISKSYYQKTDSCLLVYSISDRNSFDEIKNYYNPKIKEYCKKNIKVVLLGNKTDLENERKVSQEEGSDFALENDYLFMETSCLKNEHVSDAFETLIEITNNENNREDVTFSIGKKSNKKKDKKNCQQ